MVEGRVVDLTSGLEMECLWFCFSGLLQKIFDEVKEHWNTHRIRGSRHDTVMGRPDSLYYLPELHGVTDQFLLPLVKQKVVMLAHMLLKVVMTVITRSTSSMFVDSVDLSSLMIGSKHLSFITFSYSLHKMEAHDLTQLK